MAYQGFKRDITANVYDIYDRRIVMDDLRHIETGLACDHCQCDHRDTGWRRSLVKIKICIKPLN